MTLIVTPRAFAVDSDREHGFTMPEVLVVFLTIAIISVIALPSTVRTLQLYRLDTGVSHLSNKLMETRMNAIKRNRTAWLRVDGTMRSSIVRSTNSAGQTIDLSFPANLPAGMILDESDSIEIRFDSLGRSANGAQTFTLREANSGKRKNISISPAGKISVSQMY